MFAAMGLSAVFPVVHGVLIYGAAKMDALSGMRWTILQGVLYLTGAALYAVSTTFSFRTYITNSFAGTDP